MVDIKVVNIVASAAFAEKLDLDMIVQSSEETEYEPEQFPGLVFRISNPKTATLLFTSGKANITGAKNIEDVHKVVAILAEKLRKIGVDVFKDKDVKVVIQNMVATSDLGAEFNLTEIAVGLGLENVEYEPEQFPGLVYRVREPKVVILVFGSGRIVCAGAKKIEDILEAVGKLSRELISLGLLS
jgi:transcription initiation factor TFIID TATA-box-binding protein